MSQILFSGLDGSKLVHNNQSDNSGTLAVIDQFTLILCENVTDIEIGWDYFIIWKNLDAYISGKYSTDDCDKFSRLLQIPQHENRKVKQAIAGADNITVLTDAHDIWTYKIYSDSWKKVPSFISAVKKGKKEYVVKIAQGRCTVALTNLGHVFNIPIHLNNSDSVQFVDIACGYDHTILLTGNGNVYSTGMGTRGQLGHGDLEDCDEPKLIEALAGLKVIQISAGGWHSAIVTDQGDIYSWGWNYSGQLGLSKIQKVIAVPTVVDFKNETDEIIELNVIKVQCGTSFTVLRIDTGDFLGCGSNKYGQLGLPREDFSNLKQFVQLNIRGFAKPIKDFKCQEWGTCMFLM